MMMSTIRENHHERYAAQVPLTFHLFSNWWHLTPAMTYTWFRALRGAKTTAPKSLYHDLFLFEKSPGMRNPRGLIFSTCNPQRVVQVLEDLVVEKRLTRVQANRIEECVLGAMTADGGWR